MQEMKEEATILDIKYYEFLIYLKPKMKGGEGLAIVGRE